MTTEPAARRLWRLDQAVVVEGTIDGGALTTPGLETVDVAPHEFEALLAFRSPRSIDRVLTMTDEEKRSGLGKQIDRWIEVGVLRAAQATHGSTPVVKMLNGTSSNLFFVYAGTQGGIMMDPLEFLQGSGLSRQNVVLLKDQSQTWFLQGISEQVDSFDALVGWHYGLLDGVGHARQRYCIGSSMGAFSAIVFGHTLGVDAVWCFGLSRTSVPVRNARGEPWDIAQLLVEWNGMTRYHLHFNESSTPDREAAWRLDGMPGVELFPHPGEGHLVLKHLMETGVLQTLFPSSQRTETHRTRCIDEQQVLAVLRTVLPQHRDALQIETDLTDVLDSLALVLLLERIDVDIGALLDLEQLGPADFKSVFAIARAIERTAQN